MKNQSAAKAFYVAVIASAILPFVPVLKYGLLPFDYLNTHLHEMFHAIVAIATGGSVDSIHVFQDGSGVTMTRGGIDSAVKMAGYLGASLFGSAMVQFSTTEKAARNWMRALGVLVLGSTILWVRGDLIGFSLGLAWPAVILLLAGKLKGDNVLFAAQFFAVQQCLNAVKSLRDLIMFSGSNVATDANMLAADTHIPSIIWALMWTGVSLFGIGIAMIRISRRTMPISEPLASSRQP